MLFLEMPLPTAIYKIQPIAGAVVNTRTHATVASILLFSLKIKFIIAKKLIIYMVVTNISYQDSLIKLCIIKTSFYLIYKYILYIIV